MNPSDDRPPLLPGKVVAALDRLGRGLRSHRQVTASRLGLTVLQLEILATLAEGSPPEPLVGLLARELGVRQPTVTDSLRALEDKGLLARSPSPSDRRRTTVSLTAAGDEVVEALAEADRLVVEAVAALDPPVQEATLGALLGLVARFVEAGVVDVARTCLTCRYHRHDGAGGHRCTLLEVELPPADLRVNCPEHQEVSREG